MTTGDLTTAAHGNGQYAEVNGVNLYFETHGAGRPMLLLHGGLFSSEMFGPTLPTLAERHQVIAVDLQGHGRTADIDRPIDVRLLADDIAALIDHHRVLVPHAGVVDHPVHQGAQVDQLAARGEGAAGQAVQVQEVARAAAAAFGG